MGITWPSCVRISSEAAVKPSDASQFPARHSRRPSHQHAVASPSASFRERCASRSSWSRPRAGSSSAAHTSCLARRSVGPRSSGHEASVRSSALASESSACAIPRPARKCHSARAASARHLTSASSVRRDARTASSACSAPRSAPSPQAIKLARRIWVVASSEASPVASASACSQRGATARGSACMSASWTSTAARRVPAGAAFSACSRRTIARSVSPATSCVCAARNRRRRASSICTSGVSRRACSASCAADAGAPRAWADRAAASMAPAISASARLVGESKVAGALLVRRGDTREPCMQRPPSGGRQAHRDSRAQQRVRESQSVAFELDDACLECLDESRVRVPRERRLDEIRRRFGECSDDVHHVVCGAREPVEALAEELCEVLGDRERFARRRSDVAALERPGELEREERVPAGGLVDPQECRPDERDAEPRVDQLTCRADAEPPRPRGPRAGRGSSERSRRATPRGTRVARRQARVRGAGARSAAR